jgi:hypothetical protein
MAGFAERIWPRFDTPRLGVENLPAGFAIGMGLLIGMQALRRFWSIASGRQTRAAITTPATNASLRLDDLPEWDWYDISAHLRCTKCGTVGFVDTRPNWSEVIDFNKGVC